MLQVFVLAFIMAGIWMVLIQSFTLGAFVVGYVFGFAILLRTRDNARPYPVKLLRLPLQTLYIIDYVLRMGFDVFSSGIDVARRVLPLEDFNLGRYQKPINPGIDIISVQDPQNRELIAALSAHSITITPGELVVDYETLPNGEIGMCVHRLDVNDSTVAKLEREQGERLQRIQHILGYDDSKDTGL